jgi:hypothetical protein
MRTFPWKPAFVLAAGLCLASPAVAMADDADEFRPAAAKEDESTAKTPSIGSWLNTPPDRQAVAFDLNFNRLYFNAEGKVVGRYNRLQKKFQAGDFRPAQWHNVASTGETPAPAAESPDTTATGTSSAKPETATPTPYPIVPFPRPALPPPEPEKPKPAEIFRRGQSRSGGGPARAKVIESPKP